MGTVAGLTLLGTMSKDGLLIDEETYESFGTCLCNDVAFRLFLDRVGHRCRSLK